jgi:predicted ester cyclase
MTKTLASRRGIIALGAAALATRSASSQAQDCAGCAKGVTYTTFPQTPVERFVDPPGPRGSVAYNLWLGRMFNAVLFNTREPAEQKRIADRIVHEDYIQHNRLVEHGRKGLLAFMPYVFQALPDTRFILNDVIATAERVVTRWTWTGRVTGEGFLGVQPKGQRIEFDGIDIWTVKDGQLHEHWDQFDWPRAFVQLGVEGLPKPFYAVASQPYSR